jgi:hypothetical protein
MGAPPERAILGLVVFAGLLLIGSMAWPSFGPTNMQRTLDLHQPAGAPDLYRSRMGDMRFEVERPPERVMALATDPSEPEACESASAPRATLRGRVVFPDGSGARQAKVWSASAQGYSAEDGCFELAAENALETCQATLRGFQPSREVRNGAHGIVLQLGPAALSLSGRISSKQGRQTQGWRIALLDATLIEPVRLEAATHESASSRMAARPRSFVDGSFSVDGLSQRSYVVAAWRATRSRIELFAAAPATPGDGALEIVIPPEAECRSFELRCVDAMAKPLANLRVGLPGAPAIAATDEQGRLVLTGTLPQTLLLVLSLPDGSTVSRRLDARGPSDVVLDFN